MSLTITPPYRNTAIDNLQCIYFAIHNSVHIKCERKDFAVIDTVDDGSGLTQINVTGTLPTLTVGGKIFLSIGTFGSGLFGTYDVLSSTTSFIVINIPTVTLAGGYVNLITDRPNYFIYLRIQSVTPVIIDADGFIDYIFRKDYPNSAGVAQIDVAENMRTKFSGKNSSLYTNLNEEDSSNCIIFTVDFKEVWKGSLENWSTQVTIDAVNGAMQILNKGGSNMQLWLPTNTGGDKARFLTDASTIRRWIGFPFDIQNILGYDVVNGSNVAGLNQRELVYNQSTLITTIDTPLTGIFASSQLIQRYIGYGGGYSTNASHILYSIYNSTTAVNITEVLNIRLEHTIPCNPVYLCWLNKKGGYNYWCFSGRQQMGSKIVSEGEFEKYFLDLGEQNTTSSFLTKGGETYMIAGADRLDSNDIQLMLSLIESPRVFMLMNTPTWVSVGPVWQEVKVDIGDYKTFDTKKTFNSFELKLRLAQSYIQSN